MRKTLAAIAILSLAGCAANPKDIHPTTVSALTFAAKSCSQLARENNAAHDRLEALSKQQTSARNSDTIGVILVGVPFSKIAGKDKSREIATVKGQIIAQQQAFKAKRCK